MKAMTLGLMIVLVSGTIPAFTQPNIKWEEIWDTANNPPGWQIINNDGSAIHQDTGSAQWFWTQAVLDENGNPEIMPHAGQIFAVSTFKHANADGLLDEWLISPQIQGIEVGDSLHFHAGANDNNFKDSLRVFVSTTDSQLSSFTNQIGYFKVDGPKGTYHKYSFDLTPFAGSDIFFAVNFYIANCGPSGNHGNQPYVDHFIITGDAATHIEDAPSVVETFQLHQNYPNPFNPTTNITFALLQDSKVSLRVYNINGEAIATLLDSENRSQGQHTVRFNAGTFANGVYLYKIEAGNFSEVKKMTLLK